MIKEYEVKNIPVNDIKVDGENPNAMSDETKKRLLGSMKSFGNTQPIVIDAKTMLLADGEHRLREYVAAGKETIPAILLPFKNDAARRAYRQAANKIHGEHDKELDAKEYLKIIEAGEKELLEVATGMNYSEVEKHIRKYNPTPGRDTEPENPTTIETDIVQGDFFKLGRHVLMCGDSLKEDHFDKLCLHTNFDLLFTDAPYNINYQPVKKNHAKIKNDHLKEDEFIDFVKKFLKKAEQVAGDKAFKAYVFCNWKKYHLFYQAMEFNKTPVKSVIVWDKGRGVQNLDKYHKQHEFILYHGPFGGEKTLRGDVYQLDREKNDLHPTMKPVKLCEDFITDSTEPGMIVLDLFGGSGSTLIACENTDRRAYLMELDPKYCQVIINRWELHTGETARKV